MFELVDFASQLILRLDRILSLGRREMAVIGCARARHVRFQVLGLGLDIVDLASGQRTGLYALLDMVLLFLCSSSYVVVMLLCCNCVR